MCPRYMFILLYVKLIWCSGIPQMYSQLEDGGLGRCAFWYMLNLCGVVFPYIYGQLEEGGIGMCGFCYM